MNGHHECISPFAEATYFSHVQKEFDELAVQFENDPHVRLVLRCEETLTHNIFAAADLFVIPSIFEPCGLTQVSLDQII
jgi:glycogen synthase